MSDFYALYKGQEFKCFLKRGGQLELINKSPIDGFGIKGNVYSRTIDRSECERVYKSTPNKPGTNVREIVLTRKTTFVRVYDKLPGGSGMYGSWRWYPI